MNKPNPEQLSYSYLLLTETMLDILITPCHIAWEMNPDIRNNLMCASRHLYKARLMIEQIDEPTSGCF